MAFYGESQWPSSAGAGYDVGAGAGAPSTSWDHQTPPTRSGASSTNPREEPFAFWYQFQEVEKAWSEMIKSGKIQPGMGMPPGGRQPRIPGGPGRPHSPGFGAGRGGPGHPSSNLQNFYASQRHQPSRGSNDAEQMQQHKRRLAAQRERELRNYHQEQQFNRTATFPPGPSGPQEMNAGPVNPNPTRPDRTFSPGGTAEVPHHELIARQQSALYGKGPFGDAAGYIDENGTLRQGLPVQHGGPPNMRGPSPLTYEYGRNQPAHQESGPQSADPASGGVQPRERTSSNASPQSNPSGGKGPLEQANRTSNSSPGNGSPQNGRPPAGKTVAPIGTRPSISQGAANPALAKQSTTPLSFNSGETPTSTGASNPTSATASAEGASGLSNWGQRSGPWGSSKTQTSVWG